jgi:hypothetical protein
MHLPLVRTVGIHPSLKRSVLEVFGRAYAIRYLIGKGLIARLGILGFGASVVDSNRRARLASCNV